MDCNTLIWEHLDIQKNYLESTELLEQLLALSRLDPSHSILLQYFLNHHLLQYKRLEIWTKDFFVPSSELFVWRVCGWRVAGGGVR